MMQRGIYIVLTLILLQCGGLRLDAQYADHRNRRIDSIEQLLATRPPTGDMLLLAYRDLAYGYQEIDIAKSRYYAFKGLPLAIQAPYQGTEADLYRLIGQSYYANNQLDSAMCYYEKGLLAAGQMKNNPRYQEWQIDDNQSILYGSMGNVYNTQGKCHEAIACYIKTLRLLEKWDWKENQVHAYGNIGEMYIALENYEQAGLNFAKADSIARLTGDSLIMMHARGGIIQMHLHNKAYEEARLLAESAQRYYFAHPEEGERRATILNALSEVWFEGFGDGSKAENYARQALRVADSLGFVMEKSESLRLLASIFLARRDWNKAAQYAQQSLALDTTDVSRGLLNYGYLVKAYAQLGDSNKAWAYFDKHRQVQASRSNRNYQSALRELETKYETEKKEAHIAALKEEKQLLLWLVLAGGGMLLLTLMAALFAWRWAVQKKRFLEQHVRQLEQEKQLVATQAVLDGEIQERSRLARDLHDGLGSILAAAKYNFVDIKKDSNRQAIDMERYDKAICLLDDSMREMRRVAHHLMPDSLGQLGLKQSIADFCSSIPHVKFSYYGNEARLDPKTEVMLYRIVHELVSNALKHSGASRILVNLIREADRIALSVQDDGCGFTPLEEAKGMGLANIRARVTACHGTLLIDSKAGTGTEVSIETPVVD